MNMNFAAGQLVRISAHYQSAYGRIAMVMGGGGKEKSRVRFADLLRGVGSDPTFVRVFSNEELLPVDDIPWATTYLFIRVVEHNGPFSYHQPCLAHVKQGQTNEEVVDNVVKNWYEGGGEKLEEGGYLFIEFDREITIECQSYKEIPVSEYINLLLYLEERTLNP